MSWPALILSVLIHLVVLTGIFVLEKPTSPPRIETINLVVRPRAPLAPAIAKSRGRSRQGKRPLEKADISFGFKSFDLSGNALSDANSKGEWGEEGGDAFKHLASTGEFQRLAEEIEGLLYFPVPMRNRDLSGAISARLFFQKSGGCDWQRSTMPKGEVHFRVYVLALLKKVCAFERVAQLRLLTTDHVDLSFQFRFVSAREFVARPPFWITGNVLAFERQAQGSPIRLNLGPIQLFDGDLAHVNFGWLWNQWDQLMGGKDPLAAFQEQ
jgi:hypothetical protein